jgi:hypothetical protein
MLKALRIASPAVCALVVSAAALPTTVVARSDAKPVIKSAEVGYFGGATVTHVFSVFVYSNLGPRAGNRVMVCVGGVCKHARGHDAHLAWYSASFSSAGLRMGEAVTFTATASDAAGHSSRTFTHDLLCMHNNGSTPQT